MPLLLPLYIITEIAAPFLASLSILFGILFLGRMMPFLETLLGLGVGLADFLRISAYTVPALLLFTVPMTGMLAVILAVNRMVNDNEILALKAAGVGVARLLPAFLFFALSIALLTGYSATRLIPAGAVATKKLLFQLARERVARGLEEKKFSEGIRGLVLYVDGVDRESGALQGVYVSDIRRQDAPVTILARRATMTADAGAMLLRLSMEEGSLHRADGQVSQTIRFERYTLNLPIEAPQTVAGKSATHVGRSSMGQEMLLDAAGREGYDTPQGRIFLIEYHKRLVLAGGCFILTLLGVPLALRNRPGGRSLSLPLGLLVFVGYYLLLTAGIAVAEHAILPVGLALWLPNLVLGVLTLILLAAAVRDGVLWPVGRGGRIVPGRGHGGQHVS